MARIPLAAALAAVLAALAGAQTPLHISPAAAVQRLGGTNNIMPFAWRPNAYQQVHDAASFNNAGPTAFARLSFRMGSPNQPGATIDVEAWMALSPNDARGASQGFANNVVPGTEVNIFVRRMFVLPQVPDHGWAIRFPFDVPFIYPGNADLSWRAIVWGNSLGDQLFQYPLDAFDDAGSVRPNGALQGCQSADALFPAIHGTRLAGPGSTAWFDGTAGVTSVRVAALLVVGASDRTWQGLPLPFDLGPLGAPGCTIANSLAFALAGFTNPFLAGSISISVPLPDDRALAGATFWSQYWFAHPPANALGLFTSNGMTDTIGTEPGIARIYAASNPNAIAGVVERRFGLAIGLN